MVPVFSCRATSAPMLFHHSFHRQSYFTLCGHVCRRELFSRDRPIMPRDSREYICQMAGVNKASRFGHLEWLSQFIVKVRVRTRDLPPGVHIQFLRLPIKATFLFFAMALAIPLICSFSRPHPLDVFGLNRRNARLSHLSPMPHLHRDPHLYASVSHLLGSRPIGVVLRYVMLGSNALTHYQ